MPTPYLSSNKMAPVVVQTDSAFAHDAVLSEADGMHQKTVLQHALTPQTGLKALQYLSMAATTQPARITRSKSLPSCRAHGDMMHDELDDAVSVHSNQSQPSPPPRLSLLDIATKAKESITFSDSSPLKHQVAALLLGMCSMV